MKKSDYSAADERAVKVNGVDYHHEDIFCVVDDFYTRIQQDPVLQVPFKSVVDWSEHVEHLTHFWWVRFGGKSYLAYDYNPPAKHFPAGFNRDLLTRWLSIFHETLDAQLNPQQAALWKIISERMGEGLFVKNELMKSAHESQSRGDLK